MLFSIAYDVISPMIVGYIEETVKAEFELRTLWIAMIFFVSLLIVSVICTYFQSIILQKTGQKILSSVREDLFVHIEAHSHAQLNETPVGKLVTRVVNDTNSVSMMFTNIFVTLLKNFFVIAGVLVAMLFVNLQLTVIVLVFVPFIVLFTFIFQNLSRRASRRVNDGTTDLNTFLSENLSGMKITQIFNREERTKEAFEKKSRALGRSKQIFSVVYAFFQPMTHTLYNVSVLCLFYFGAKGYISDTTFSGPLSRPGWWSRSTSTLQNFSDPFRILRSSLICSRPLLRRRKRSLPSST
jgi:ATP-binding cassette subfamily B protein